jgi:hypothetical protein
MKILSPLAEPEVILEFLKAEINSPRWAKPLTDLLNKMGLSKSLFLFGNITDNEQNVTRKEVLFDFRNQRDKSHFEGFPDNIKWHSAQLNKDDFRKMRYMNYPFWVGLSDGTRLAIDAVRYIDRENERPDIIKHIKQTSDTIRDGIKIPRVILVAENTLKSPVIFEGHIRATAYCLNIDKLPINMECIIGFSENIINWKWY